ncbi:antibiotic biosynthesis monooxygenase [Pseudomonas sp. WJP1]|uniref:putative quinol monooxygenase n=1 Tax=Pseudomonas sp. WJP1 TaxID=2986947 RepID=UPI002349FED2|nr:putative quinol monooxygenase [Pseudomonas sp. WJP1]WCM53830.1 antibiotic biosynthesis monooxygenase [Pseudomonas sp. WJP1]
MNTRVYVMASFVVKPQGLEGMRGVLAELSRQTCLEPGCLEYAYYQSLANPLEFSSFEVWESAESEARHWQTRHLQAALAQASDLLQGDARIVKYQRVTA